MAAGIKVDGTKLRRKMDEHLFTGADMARSIGISPSSFSFILNGKRGAQPATLRRICDVLECEPVDLLKGV